MESTTDYRETSVPIFGKVLVKMAYTCSLLRYISSVFK